MKKLSLLTFFLFAFILNTNTYAEKLTIFAVDEPPSSFLNDHGEPEGFSIDIVHEIQRRINNFDKIRIVPEIRALLCKKECENKVLIGFSKTPSRETKYHWITLLFRKSWILYSKNNADFEISNLEDAKKVKGIGVVRGDIRENYLKQRDFKNIVEVSTHELALKMLLKNRIQLFFYEPQGVSILLNKLKIPKTELRVMLDTHSSEVYIMMPSQTSMEIIRKWRIAADQMKEDGTFQSIVVKWEKVFKQYGINYRFDKGVLDFRP
ncbi:MAG: transporter substrate-binding domain-containing protein [Desulfobacter sp.]|nr:MAG: transporter substrate-binding domain-containing protein [Desulfobacter sp.]